MTKTSGLFFFLVSTILIYACGSEEEPDAETPVKACGGETLPDIFHTNRDEKVLTSSIMAEVFEGVDHIEISTTGPAFSRSGGYTQSYQVNSLPADQWIQQGDSVFYWNLPFGLNETNRSYELEVSYYCVGDPNPTLWHTEVINVQTIDFCGEISESTTGLFKIDAPRINGGFEDPITTSNFNVKFYIGYHYDQGFGDLLQFPLEHIDNATVKLNSGDQFSASYELTYGIESLQIDDETSIDRSYLTADIDLTELFGLSHNQMAGGYVAFSLTICGYEQELSGYQLR